LDPGGGLAASGTIVEEPDVELDPTLEVDVLIHLARSDFLDLIDGEIYH
jgi:hypothetical protein